MKRTKELPREGSWRERIVFAWLPIWFKHKAEDGTPLKTMVWLEKYKLHELYQYGSWDWKRREML